MNGLSVGDRVKLTDRYASVLMRSNGPKPKVMDWKARRGEVCRLNSYSVFVLWDGRRSPDPFPYKAVEKVTEAAERVA